MYVQIIRAHRLEREADYAAQREQEWEQALQEEAQRHRYNLAALLHLYTMISACRHFNGAKVACACKYPLDHQPTCPW